MGSGRGEKKIIIFKLLVASESLLDIDIIFQKQLSLAFVEVSKFCFRHLASAEKYMVCAGNDVKWRAAASRTFNSLSDASQFCTTSPAPVDFETGRKSTLKEARERRTRSLQSSKRYALVS
jgi:hypothetical protein